MAEPKILRAWKLGGLKELEVGHAPMRSWIHTPNHNVDVRKVGDGRGNSAVDACLQTLWSAFVEAPVAHKNLVEGNEEQTSFDHPAVTLLNQPNPHMTGDLLWHFVLGAVHAAGDGYVYKQRDLSGRVRELWPLYPEFVTPEDGNGALATPEEREAQRQGRGPMIAYYEYKPGSEPKRLEVADVIDFRIGVDRANPRVGYAPLRSVLREVLADEEAGQFSTALLSNMGIPGVVISSADPNDLGPSGEEAKQIERRWRDRFGGRNRGRPLVMEGGPVKVDVVSFSPEQLNLNSLRRVPEERISAVLGVPAILANLGAGLDRATYSNARELREFFTEQKVLPLWNTFGQILTTQLLVEWLPTPTESIGFDTSDVRALQDDEDKLFERWQKAASAGLVTVADFRRAVGLDATEADEVYLRPASVVEVPTGETMASSGIRDLEQFLDQPDVQAQEQSV